MAYPQTSTGYQGDMPAFAGMDGGGDHVTDAAFNEESSAEIRPGIFVARGTVEQGALLLASVGDVLWGVHLHSHKFAKPDQFGEDGVLPACSFNVRGQGRVWVLVEEAITQADIQDGSAEVHIRAEAENAEVAGACRQSADGSDCIDASGWAQWITPTITDENGDLVALLEFDTRNWRA